MILLLLLCLLCVQEDGEDVPVYELNYFIEMLNNSSDNCIEEVTTEVLKEVTELISGTGHFHEIVTQDTKGI